MPWLHLRTPRQQHTHTSTLHAHAATVPRGARARNTQATVLLPCRDCFALEALKDHVPQHLWHLPAVKAAGLRISQAWGMATVGSALAALVRDWRRPRRARAPPARDAHVLLAAETDCSQRTPPCCAAAVAALLCRAQAPAALSQRATQHALHIVCDYVIVLLLLAAAAAVQWRVSARVLAAIKALQAGDTAAGVERWVQEQSASVRGGGIAAGEDVVCTLEQQPHPQQPRQQLGAPGAPAKPRLSTDSAASRQTAPCVVVHASDGPVGRPT
jgi:hypothetical protein